MNEAQRAQFDAEQFYQDWAKTYPGLAGPFASPGWIPDLVQAAYAAGAADAREQDIALAKCQAEKEEEGRNFGRGNAIRMVITKLREVKR